MSMRPKKGGHQKVGYGRPPLHTRFKKRQSGNPKGRPRVTDPAQLLRREANRLVSVRSGDRIVRMTAAQAMIRNLWMLAAKGNLSAIKLVLPAIQDVQSEGMPSPSISITYDPHNMTNEQLRDFLRRRGIITGNDGGSVPWPEEPEE